MKKILTFLFLAILLSTVLLPASTHVASAQTANEVTADKNRRTLFHMIACLSRDSTFDDDDDLTAPDDIFDSVDEEGKYYYINQQVEVVGLDIDKSDGVISCAEAITNGANILTPNSVKSSSLKDVGNYLTARIFGTSFATSSGTINMDSGLLSSKVAELVNEATTRMNGYAAQVSGASLSKLLQGRTIGLVKMCFDAYSSTNGQGSEDLATEVPGVGFFYKKKRKDVIGTTGNLVSFLKEGNLSVRFFGLIPRDRDLFVGDVNTDYELMAQNTDDNWDNGVNFYPVGRDTSATQGFSNGLIDCEYIIDNPDLVFNGIRVSDDGSFENQDGTPLTGALADAVTASEDLASAGSGSGDNCETAADFAFAFVLCPFLELSNRALGWLDNRIISALNVDQAYYNDEDVRHAWGNIRNIAYILLIPVTLLMVIGTALQLSFVDPYTVKRALPRLFVAIIFIAISYNACVLMIDIVNGVGKGVAGVITAPFGGLEGLTLSNIFNPDGLDNGLFVGGALAGVGIAFLSGVTIWTLLSFLGMAVLALVIIFALLSVRELLIVFLLVISPIAIIAWIFPGNDKPWKLWWGSFSKMLYLYPIIMAFIGTGRAFASVVGKAEGDAVVSTLTKLVAFIGPYFFIPKAFQMAGGAFATLAGMVNDKGKGVFDRQRKFRQNNMKGARDRNLSGNRFRNAPEGSIRSRINRSTQSAAQLKDAGFVPSRVRAAKRLHAAHELESIQKDPGAMSVLANDDAANAFMSGRGTKEDMIKYLMSDKANDGAGYGRDDATQIASELQLLSRAHGAESMKQAAFIQLAGSKTAYRGGPAEMLNAAYEAAGGDTQIAASLYAKARSAAEGAGRVDLAGYSYGEGLGEAQKIWQARAQGMDESGMASLSGGINDRLLNKVIDSKGVGAIVQSHGTAAKTLMPVLQQRLERATQDFESARISGDYGAMDEAHTRQMASAAEIANTYDYVNYAAPEVAREMRDKVLTRRINYTDTAYQEVDVPEVQRIQTTDPATGNIVYKSVPVMEEVRDSSGATVVRQKMTKGKVPRKDASGKPIETTRSMSTLEFVESVRDDKDFRSIRREQMATEEDRRRMAGGGPTPII